SYFGYRPAINGFKGYWETVDRLGKDRNPYRAGFLQLVAISENDAQADAESADAAKYFYQRCLHVPHHFFAAPGYMTGKSVEQAKTPFSYQSLKQLTWKRMVDDGYIIAGSPATVRDRLASVVKELRVGHVMLLCQFGNLSKAQTLK